MKKKVLFISVNDWANSGFKYSEAINMYSKRYECKYFCFNEHPFGYYRDNVLIDGESGFLNNEAINKLREYANECDIIHCKENSGIIIGFEDIKFDINKPIVQTFGGSVYRTYHTEIRKRIAGISNVCTVTTPDLVFDDEILVPLPIDTNRHVPIEKSNRCIIIGHSPTNRTLKGTDQILEAVGVICGEHSNVFMNMQEGLKFNYAIELKRINHIFIDQIVSGYYSNSAVEAMSLGSACLAKNDYGATGVIDVDASTLYDELNILVNDQDYLYNSMMRARKFCVETHSYNVVCDKLERVYDLAIERNEA